MSVVAGAFVPYSVSRILEYDRCPRRFYFKYVEQLPEIIENTGFFGAKVHEAIAAAMRGRSDWEEILADLPYDELEEAKIKVLTAIKRSKELGKVVGVETKFALTEDMNFTDFDSEDAWFRGVIDLITQKNGYLAIWDWKTGHSKPSRFQITIYAWAVMNLLKRPVTKAGYILLTSNDVLEFDLTDEDFHLVETKLRKLINRIENDDEFSPTPGMHCAYCSYVAQCPLLEVVEAKDIPAIRNDQEACEIFKTIKVLEEKIKRYKKALNGYVEQKDSGKLRVDDGIYKVEYVPYIATKRGVDKHEFAKKVWELVQQELGDDPFSYFKLEVKTIEPFIDRFQEYVEVRKRKLFKFEEFKEVKG